MTRFGRALPLALLLLSGCITARMVRVRNYDVSLPRERAVGWKAELAAFRASYDRAPMVTAGDPRFDPIFGGLSTLIYFGDDLGGKLLDQRIPSGWAQSGVELAQACSLHDPQPTSRSAVPTPGPAFPVEPDYTPLWIPASLTGDLLPSDARCDPSGQAAGAGRFCIFGGLALQQREPSPLLIIVHGMFDSSAQAYVRKIGATLYARGFSILLVDMRDHGNTLRAAPSVATTLGALEASDVLAIARLVHRVCAERVTTVGGVGVSGGALDVITAYAADGGGGRAALDGGAVALSPLLDVAETLEDMSEARTCSTVQAIELTWAEHLVLGGAGALTFFGGAALADALNHERLGTEVGVAAGVGAVAGIGSGLILDGLADGDSATSDGCVGKSAVAAMFSDLLYERWRTLRSTATALAPAARSIPPERISLAGYLDHRVKPFYESLGKHVVLSKPESLASALRTRAQRTLLTRPRLLVLGAADDPVIRVAALRSLARRTAGLADVDVVELAHGGHGAFWIVQYALTRSLLTDLLGPAQGAGPRK